MNRFDEMVNDHTVLRWTKDEMADWIAGLPQDKQDVVLNGLTTAKERGLDTYKLACKFRVQVEAKDKKNKMSLVDFWSTASIGWALGGLINGNKKLG